MHDASEMTHQAYCTRHARHDGCTTHRQRDLRPAMQLSSSTRWRGWR
ncbi:hypothetical protein BIFGAL_04421 [Bifidobacterium gallicum DSM 20093 = LMG 11596]|uniref:Uncharacterized protein n=1 Tax=Bifidobacterium gallicum DSM 20093 = LMG 11596 TaxID=561180 RepID=D1NX14_9BIFI|nr:hypothetical protein BIFGAL_04421 [Bifidobacterium gallicum DSM 20093 = LMG 11596]